MEENTSTNLNSQIPTTEPHIPETNIGQKTIRTYESDIAESIEHKKMSQVSINTAQVERQRAKGMQIGAEMPESKASVGKNILKILLSLVLIAAGVLGGYYLYSISPLAQTTPAAQQGTALVPAIITPDAQKTINVQGASPSEIVSKMVYQSSNTFGNGQMMELIFYDTPVASTSSPVRLTASDFISKVGLNPPDVLTRSLADSWMFGIYQTNNMGEPFIILTTTFFQNAFSGMLKWEPTMADDLSKVFSLEQSTTMPANTITVPAITSSTASTTATTTASTTVTSSPTPAASLPPTGFFGIRGTFVDKVIQNKDVREFQDSNGNILFLYAFIDNSTLVIAQGEDALNEVITRFEKRAYVR